MGQVIVGNALLQELGFDLIIVVGHQNMVLVHCRFVVIGIGRNTMLHLEEVVGIPIHIGFRRGSKAHHEGVKILKNGPVFLENAPVAFINDNQVKVGRSKQLPPVLGLGIVNGVENGGIGGKHNASGTVILVGA